MQSASQCDGLYESARGSIVRAASVVTAAVWIVAAGQASAISTLSTRADALVVGASGQSTRQTDTTEPTGDAVVTTSGTNTNGSTYSGSAEGHTDATDYGDLRIWGSADMTGDGQATGSSQIVIRDTQHFDGFDGQTGTLDISFLVDGSMSDTNNAISSVQSKWTITIATVPTGASGPPTRYFLESALLSDGFTTGLSQCAINGVADNNTYQTCTGLFTVTVPFIWGTDFDWSISFDAFAQAVTHGPTHVGSSSYDLQNSLVWGGISNVTANGVLVTDYAYSSDSGFDWRQSSISTNGIPEPATLALLSLGLAGLGFARRRGVD